MSLLALELSDGSLQGTVLERDGGAVSAGACAAVDGGLEALPGLLAQLGPHPRDAILLCDQVTTACVEAPPTAGLPVARVEGLVRWELESYLPDAPGGLVCGWSATHEAAGALLAAALPTAVRDAHATALAAAGLRLGAIYPALGPAAALLPEQAEPCTLVELSASRVGCARVEAGRVVRFRTQTLSADPVDAVLELEDPDAPLVLAGPLPAEVANAPEVAGLPRLAPGDVSASALGAACQRWGLPGGERVPALAACAARPPLWRRGSTRVVLAVAALLLLVGGVELGLAVQTRRLTWRLEAGRRLVVEREAQVASRERLQADHDRLTADLASLTADEAVYGVCAQRRAFLPALLAAVAEATPSSVVIESLVESEGQHLELHGVARDELSVRALQRDLATRLAPLGLAPLDVRIRRREDPSPGHAFEISFAPVEDAG